MNESKAVAILIDNSATSIDGDFIPNRLSAQLMTAERYAAYLFQASELNQVAIGTLGDTEFGIRASFTTSIQKIGSIFDNIKSSGNIDLVRGLKRAILALHHCNNGSSQNQQISQSAQPVSNINISSPSKQSASQQQLPNSYENNNNNYSPSRDNKEAPCPIIKQILAFVGGENNITDENKSDIAKLLSEEDISLDLVVIGNDVPNQQTLKDLIDQIKPELESKFWPIPHSKTILADNVISLAIKQFNPTEMFGDDPSLQDAINLSKNSNQNEIKREEKVKTSSSVKTKVSTRRIKCSKHIDQQPQTQPPPPQQQQQQQQQQIPQQQIIANQRPPVHIVHPTIPHMQIRQPGNASIQQINIMQPQQQPQQMLHASSSSPQPRALSPQQQTQTQQIQIPNGISVSPLQQQPQIIYQIAQYSQMPQIPQIIQYPHIQQQQPQRPIVISSQMPMQQPMNPITVQQQIQPSQIQPQPINTIAVQQQIQPPQINPITLQQQIQPQPMNPMTVQQIQHQYQQQIQQQQYQQFQQQQQQQQQQYQQQIQQKQFQKIQQQQQIQKQKSKSRKGANSKNPKDS